MTKKEREAQERELFENLEKEKKLFWAIDEIDQAVKKVKKLLRLCGKSKDGLSYWWYAGTIEAVIELLEVVGYEVKKREVEE